MNKHVHFLIGAKHFPNAEGTEVCLPNSREPSIMRINLVELHLRYLYKYVHKNRIIKLCGEQFWINLFKCVYVIKFSLF